MLVFEKLKKLFQRKKPEDGLEEDDFLEEAEEKETDADISYTDDEEPEEQAKTIKKKAIMVAGGAAVLFAVSAIASNVFLGGSGKGNSDKALSGPVSAATPARPPARCATCSPRPSPSTSRKSSSTCAWPPSAASACTWWAR